MDRKTKGDIMAADQFREVTSQSWFSRIGNSIKGILVGLIFFIAAFPLLFWNEGRSVKRVKALEEGISAVVSVSSEKVDPGNEGKLVHLSGKAVTDETLTDSQFGISANALKLRRVAEMYQWKEETRSETRNKTGGGTETVTTYTYDKTWSEGVIDSSSFKQSAGHENPGSMPFQSEELQSSRITLGAFTLSSSLAEMISGYRALPVNDMATLPETARNSFKLVSGVLYASENPTMPKIGDVRVSFMVVDPCEVSVVSRQVRETFEPYTTSNGGTIELLEKGVMSAQLMFAAAQKRNILLTWLLRAAGFFLMFIGLGMIFKPLSVLADVLPIAGRIVGAGTGLIAFLVSLALSAGTIAVAWLFYRPALGITLLVIAAGAIVLAVKKIGGKKAHG
jgi:hypothetical protein